mgnify:CR=1 FL=1
MIAVGHGLDERTLQQIRGVLTRFSEVREAVLFGSRAKGTHRAGSDIDLAIVGEGVDWRTLGRIDDAFDDLLLPYRFSLITLGQTTDPEVAAHVQRVGHTLYVRGDSVRV